MEDFSAVLADWPDARRTDVCQNTTQAQVARILTKDNLAPVDFLRLLSPAASDMLEDVAKRAHQLTLRYFGRAVSIFTPLYISDICTNQCRYCGFNAKNKQKRTHLSVDEAFKEAKFLHDQGHRNILLLTGDAPKISSPAYMAEVVSKIKPLFASIGIEVYALSEDEYSLLVKTGVDSMTMFQETYNPELYAWLHPVGPKHDYHWRLAAPTRACQAGMRSVGVGALLGLEAFEQDTFATGLHAYWLERTFPGVDIGISIPRICPHEGEFEVQHPVDDRHFAQYVAALRCFLPRSCITCSTRESAYMRNHLLALGVTRISAGVSTKVGGRSTAPQDNPGQFEITDKRSLTAVCEDLANLGYQAVLKDWEDPTESSAQTACA